MTTTDATPVACDPNDLGERMASWMESHVGMLETDGRNLGPLINEWNRRVGNPEGSEWCAATAYSAAFECSRDLGIVNPCPRTGGALRMWQLVDAVCRVVTPRRGDLGFLDHGHGKGHVIVVTREFVQGAGLCWASGNTNADGSRTGDSLLVKCGDPEEAHHGELVGFARLSLAPTRPVLVA